MSRGGDTAGENKTVDCGKQVEDKIMDIASLDNFLHHDDDNHPKPPGGALIDSVILLPDNNINTTFVSASNSSKRLQPENGQKRMRGLSFNVHEDILVVLAWLNTDMDRVRGSDPIKSTYWGRVWKYFHEHKQFESDRDEKSLRQRWVAIQTATNIFCGCYAQIENLHPSGKNDEDKIADAKVLYVETQQKKFLFDHCWNILRRQPKWLDEINKQKPLSRGKGVNSSPSVPSPSNPGTLVDIMEDDVPSNGFVQRPLGSSVEKRKMGDREKNVSMSSPSTPGTLVDIADDSVPNTGFVRRPLGNNSEKRRMRDREKNVTDHHVIGDILKDMVEGTKKSYAAYREALEEKRQMSAKRMEMLERHVQLQEEKLRLEAERQRLEAERKHQEQSAYEERIMTTDTSSMHADAQEYYSRLRKKILERI